MGNEVLNYLVGKTVKIDRGGPESRIAIVLDVYVDHLVVLTEEDGVIYYPIHHIKSITDSLTEKLALNLEIPEGFDFKKADNFQGILDSLKFQWVKINRGGPEKLEGVLSEVTNDYVSLINKEEIVRLSMFHIKNISYGLKIEKAEEEQSNNQNTNQFTNSEYDERSSRYEESYARRRSERGREFSRYEQSDSQSFNERAVVPSSSEDPNLSELMTSMEKFFRNLAKTNPNSTV
ncbi:spore coat protein [Bacillus sp. BRMEA1]|uniref:spore coat protein n=1 Tax=Neobacillus endophyticus TaxID=2738405 RepID=UPI0015668C2D|nr:spore coat protein [Neobacillus endophyticus]NRD79482.1 spore coat protein [Neobacillus endophyticus]